MADKNTAKKSAAVLAQERDAELIRKTFKDEDTTLLRTIRTLMLGLDLLEDEKKQIRNLFQNPALCDLFKRRFLPSITDSKELALGQVQDIWLGAEKMIFGANAEQREQATKYKEKSIAFTMTALALLEDTNGKSPQYEVKTFDQDPLQIDLMARNMFIQHVDTQLMILGQIANQKVGESTAQEQTRRQKNSGR